MRRRLAAEWFDIQDSLWFIPALMTSSAALLALVMVRVDSWLLLDQRSATSWLFEGGSEGARGVLSAIAGTMITVTGVVFSITIVALQLASSQFTPRVLRTFTGDRGNQVVLGVFIATFTYALLVLRSVRSAAEDRQVFVPSASVTIAILFALASIGFLIYYIHHAARSIQASVVIDRAARDTLSLVDTVFPRAGEGESCASAAPATVTPSTTPVAIRADAGGYLQNVDEDVLLQIAAAGNLVLQVEISVGAFVLPGASLASVWPPAHVDLTAPAENGSTIEAQVIATFLLGSERTLAHDLALGVRQLADIAIKALSPGINDPTTATMCIDRLAETLVIVAQRPQPNGVRRGDEGKGRVTLPPLTFDDLVQIAFGQIRHYGASDPTVALHLVTTLGHVAALIPPVLRASIDREARLLLDAVRRSGDLQHDQIRVERAGAWATDGRSA